MATKLRDAQITVRLDTEQAKKDADRLDRDEERKKKDKARRERRAERRGGGAGGPGRGGGRGVGGAFLAATAPGVVRGAAGGVRNAANALMAGNVIRALPVVGGVAAILAELTDRFGPIAQGALEERADRIDARGDGPFAEYLRFEAKKLEIASREISELKATVASMLGAAGQTVDQLKARAAQVGEEAAFSLQDGRDIFRARRKSIEAQQRMQRFLDRELKERVGRALGAANVEEFTSIMDRLTGEAKAR